MRLSIDVAHLALFVRGLQWLLGLCAGWLIIQPFVMGVPMPATALATDGASSESNLPTPQSRLSLNDLEGVWTRPLRQTLIEPKPKEIPQEKPAPPPPAVVLPRLVATFVEGGRSWGLFVDDKGNQRVRSASQTIDNFEIASIDPGSAKLKRGEKIYEVKVMHKNTLGQGAKRRSNRQ